MNNIDFVGEDPILENSAIPINGCTGNQDIIQHNNLGGLQGASLNERYHLTKAQWESINDSIFALLVGTQDIEITDSTKGIILKDSGDNTRRRITIHNGAIVVSPSL